jgi:ribonuclease-3
LKADIEEILGYRFRDKGLLRTALTHRSYIGEKKEKKAAHNERLEFLGDSVLSLILSEHLYRGGGLDEAGMSKARAHLSRGSELARAAEGLGLGEHLLIGKGEETTGGRKKQSILAGVFEAVLGAVYMDGGYEAARGLVLSVMGEKLRKLEGGRYQDAKTRLQELFQKEYGRLPVYKIMKEEGAEHEKLFTAGVYHERKLFGKGRGRTKKEAETRAAEEALEKMEQ